MKWRVEKTKRRGWRLWVYVCGGEKSREKKKKKRRRKGNVWMIERKK